MSSVKLSPESAKALVYILGGIAAIVLVFVVIKKFGNGLNALMEKLGLRDSKEEKEQDATIKSSTKASADPSSPWSPRYYKSVPAGSSLVTNASAKVLAKQLWDSVGVMYDSPERGLAAIKQLPSQAALSYVADIFNQTYKVDLYSWLEDRYDTDTQKSYFIQMVNYVNKMKKY